MTACPVIVKQSEVARSKDRNELFGKMIDDLVSRKYLESSDATKAKQILSGCPSMLGAVQTEIEGAIKLLSEQEKDFKKPADKQRESREIFKKQIAAIDVNAPFEALDQLKKAFQYSIKFVCEARDDGPAPTLTAAQEAESKTILPKAGKSKQQTKDEIEAKPTLAEKLEGYNDALVRAEGNVNTVNKARADIKQPSAPVLDKSGQEIKNAQGPSYDEGNPQIRAENADLKSARDYWKEAKAILKESKVEKFKDLPAEKQEAALGELINAFDAHPFIEIPEMYKPKAPAAK